MPRQARIDAPGALQHVIARGIERRTLFEDDRDRHHFLDRLGQILEKGDTRCYAWVLMPNHFHLLLRTGAVPVATVMRRLLTGHAVYYNRRHNRQGHLFQNRYKSILCQEDTYFMELVRYIHLNPLRAGLVEDVMALDRYPFAGHGVIMGKFQRSWQDRDAVLAFFGRQVGAARRSYRAFVAKGIDQGRREDLTGGGLVRSSGGWTAVKALRSANTKVKGDERILGDGDFVEEMLSRTDQGFESRYALESKGMDVDAVALRVARLLDLDVKEVWRPGRYRHLVKARSLLCYWSVRELGMTMAAMARRLSISAVAVSKSVDRGARIVEEEGIKLIS